MSREICLLTALATSFPNESQLAIYLQVQQVQHMACKWQGA